MAAFVNAAWIGDRTVRPTDAQLTTLSNWAAGLGAVDVGFFWRHVGYFVLPLTIHTDPNNNTKYSLALTTKIPFKVVSIDVGCESAAGSAATADIEKNPEGAPDTWATMSTGAVDIKTGAGDYQNLPVLDGAEDVAEGDELRLAGVGTGAGAVVGTQALLHCFRL